MFSTKIIPLRASEPTSYIAAWLAASLKMEKEELQAASHLSLTHTHTKIASMRTARPPRLSGSGEGATEGYQVSQPARSPGTHLSLYLGIYTGWQATMDFFKIID